MTPLLCVVLLAAGADPACGACGSGLELEVYKPLDKKWKPPRVPYDPQPGDIAVFQHRNPLAHILYSAVLCGGATHVALVVSRPDGSPAFLEAPFATPMKIWEIKGRMRSYHGQIYIRRRHVPLTPEQSARLTAYACAQEGKPYHLLGLLLPPIGWPVRKEGERCTRPDEIDKKSYICSEIVITALVAAGVLDPCVVRPWAVCAADVWDDKHLDLSCGWQKPALLRFAEPKKCDSCCPPK